jgi:hypothetical protein
MNRAMFVMIILAEFVNRSTCKYPTSCLRVSIWMFIFSISYFMSHLVPVHLVTAMDVSIGNRTLWSLLPVQVRLYVREIIWARCGTHRTTKSEASFACGGLWVVRLNMYINIRIIMWYFYVVWLVDVIRPIPLDITLLVNLLVNLLENSYTYYMI